MNQRKIVQSLISAAAVITIGLPLSASAAAPSQFEDASVKVSYKDLNIESEAGAQSLYARLKHASKKACNLRSRTVTGSLRAVAEAKRCYNETLEAAVKEIDNDTLTRIHES